MERQKAVRERVSERQVDWGLKRHGERQKASDRLRQAKRECVTRV